MSASAGDDELLRRNVRLQAEARDLYAGRGLQAILSDYGRSEPVGSYALGLMTWRDLDVYLLAPDISVATFFVLGARLAETLAPARMSFRDERVARSEGLPRDGLYWGIHLPGGEEPGWKIDLWAMGGDEFARLVGIRDGIARRLTPEARVAVLRIKGAFCDDPRYRKTLRSTDIYHAVLEHGVRDPEGFRTYLRSVPGGK